MRPETWPLSGLNLPAVKAEKPSSISRIAKRLNWCGIGRHFSRRANYKKKADVARLQRQTGKPVA
jgi:hypothetical protein